MEPKKTKSRSGVGAGGVEEEKKRDGSVETERKGRSRRRRESRPEAGGRADKRGEDASVKRVESVRRSRSIKVDTEREEQARKVSTSSGEPEEINQLEKLRKLRGLLPACAEPSSWEELTTLSDGKSEGPDDLQRSGSVVDDDVLVLTSEDARELDEERTTIDKGVLPAEDSEEELLRSDNASCEELEVSGCDANGNNIEITKTPAAGKLRTRITGKSSKSSPYGTRANQTRRTVNVLAVCIEGRD